MYKKRNGWLILNHGHHQKLQCYFIMVKMAISDFILIIDAKPKKTNLKTIIIFK